MLYTDNGFKLLKFMAVYGANASGKSNLVEAMGFAQDVILREIPNGSINCYCRIAENNVGKPSHFEFRIKIGDIKYVYGFNLLINSRKFVSEYLRQHKYGAVYKTIFSRNIEKGLYEVDSYFKDTALNERLRIYADDVRNDGSILFCV